MDTLEFYKELEPVRSFRDVGDLSSYVPVPEGWVIAVTDVVNSTEAIRAGRYKDVNVAGTLGAMALANIESGLEFPFLFGGDGMVFVLPERFEAQARSVLADVRARVRELYSLELRVGIVPTRDIYERGGRLQIGKFAVSDSYHQAMFAGNGIELAERLVKSSQEVSDYLVDPDEPIELKADLEGFSCRWKDIPSTKGEIVAIIVDLKGDAPRQSQSLRRVLELVERLLGSDEDYHPLSVESMTIDTGRETRAIEAGAVVERSSGLRFVLRMIRIRIEMFVVSVALALHLPLRRGRKRLDRIKEDNYINSDFRKFDGTLKMIVATTSAQRQVLERLLSDLRRQGVINYGLHVSDRALMTCLVHFGSGSEVHFVDAADGGYAIAARQIKQQIAEDGR